MLILGAEYVLQPLNYLKLGNNPLNTIQDLIQAKNTNTTERNAKIFKSELWLSNMTSLSICARV